MNLTFRLMKWRPRLGAVAIAAAALGPVAPRGWASDDHHAEQFHAVSVDVSEESASGLRGIKLGKFKIRTSHTVSSRKDGVSFTLHATVKKDDFETFERLYGHRKNKIRDQVVVATRLVPIEDYDDPELKQFRRRILLRLRRTMPELPIADVYISDFTLSAESL
jgi:hypothetical protein